jgi:hypothetical protein
LEEAAVTGDRVVELELVCVECGACSETDASGSRAFLTVDDEAAIYCPRCAAAEFGDAP